MSVLTFSPETGLKKFEPSRNGVDLLFETGRFKLFLIAPFKVIKDAAGQPYLA